MNMLKSEETVRYCLLCCTCSVCTHFFFLFSSCMGGTARVSGLLLPDGHTNPCQASCMQNTPPPPPETRDMAPCCEKV